MVAPKLSEWSFYCEKNLLYVHNLVHSYEFLRTYFPEQIEDYSRIIFLVQDKLNIWAQDCNMIEQEIMLCFSSAGSRKFSNSINHFHHGTNLNQAWGGREKTATSLFLFAKWKNLLYSSVLGSEQMQCLATCMHMNFPLI